MRHFLALTLPVGGLTAAMTSPPLRSLLIALAGLPEASPASESTALGRAIAVSTITPRADIARPRAKIAEESAAVGSSQHLGPLGLDFPAGDRDTGPAWGAIPGPLAGGGDLASTLDRRFP